MKVLAICVLVLVCFGEIQSANLRKEASNNDNYLQKLRNMGNNGSFSKRMISTIEVSLATGDKVSEVIGLVEDSLAEQRTTHSNLIRERDITLAEISENIQTIQGELAEDKASLEVVKAKLKELRTTKTTADNKISALSTEIDNLAIRRVAVEEARANDIRNFQRRQLRDSNAIAALSKIIPQLVELRDGSIGAEGTDYSVLLQESKISHPIEALVQLSTQLNPRKLDFVIGKLTEILEGIEQNKAVDEAQEAEGEAKFNQLIIEIETVTATKVAQRVAAQKVSVRTGKQIEKFEEKEDQLKEEIEDNTALLESQQQLFDVQTENFATKINNSQQAIEALEVALEILEEGRETLESSEETAEDNAQ